MSLGLLILAGTAGMLLLVVFIVLFVVLYQRKIGRQQEAHQRALLEAAIQTQEEERSRIAADLHDDIQQQFSAVVDSIKRISMKLDAARLPDSQGSGIAGMLENTVQMAENAVKDIRRISHNLMPPTLKKIGIAEALHNLSNQLSETGMKTSFVLGGEYERLEAGTELLLYRVVKELVNNTLKHAEATRITMAMNCTPALPPDKNGCIAFVISDNGKGFDTKEKGHKGLGMRNIESRLRMINADYDIESQPGKGTGVTIVIETNSNSQLTINN